MKLFLKHLFRSMRQRPLQPILLILSLSLAIATSIFNYSIEEALDEETKIAQSEGYGSSDLLIELTGSSKSRFMFASDINELLGEEVVSVGCLELPVFFGESRETVFGVATDFENVDKIFDFSFSQYGKLTPSSVSTSAFITSSFADEHGLSVGDELMLTAFGADTAYTVQGISKNRFMGSFDVMVDVKSVVHIMAADSLLISAVSDSVKPATAIYLKLGAEDSLEDCAALLREDVRFEDKSIVFTHNLVDTMRNTESMSNTVDVLILVSSILCAAVVFCCFFVLSSERSEENYSFSLSGASPLFLGAMQYLEVFIYWIVGGLLGILISLPLLRMAISAPLFKYASFALKPICAIKSLAIVLLVLVLTVALFRFSRRFRYKKREEQRLLGVSSVASVLIVLFAFAVLLTVPAQKRFIWLILAISAIMISLFICVPQLMRKGASYIGAVLDRRMTESFNCKHISFRYAIKNAYTVKMLHNISRLVSVIICIVLLMGTVVISTFGFVTNVRTFFDSGYVVMNATESCYEKLSQCESVDKITRIYINDGAFSAESADVFSDNLKITKLPKGNEGIVSSGLAKYHGIGVGDTHRFGATECEIVVTEIVDSGFNFLLFDCEYFELGYNAIVASGKAGVPDGELLSEISDKTALELVAISDISSLFEEKITTIEVYYISGAILAACAFLFAFIGVFDSLYMSYRARRDEFELYAVSGMTARDIRRMKITEISATFVIGVVTGFVGYLLALVATEAGLLAFMYETLLNVKCFFFA